MMVSRNARIAVVLGVAVRVFVVIAVVPVTQLNWFEPFTAWTLHHPSIDPWQSWLSHGGASDAFPYSPILLVFCLAFGAVGSTIPVPHGVQLGIAIGVLLTESVCWIATVRAAKQHSSRALVVLAISPLILWGAYIHGQLDLVPAALILLSLTAVRGGRWGLSGLLLGLAVAAKFSSLLVLPILVVFFVRNSRFRRHGLRFFLGMIPGILLAAGPVALSGYRAMVVQTPKLESLVAFGVTLGPNFTVLLAPLVIAAVLVGFWRFRRGNIDLLLLGSTAMLAIVPIFVPASPGWYLWSVPLLALLVTDARLRYSWLLTLFGVVVGSASAATHSWAEWRWSSGGSVISAFAQRGFAAQFPAWVPSLLNSASVACITILTVIVLHLTHRYDSYQLSQAPLSVAVSGDSGTGKDTLCRSLADVFDGSDAAFILGDDYHSFERGSPVWKVKTHLDPAANDIARLTKDAMELLRGEPIWSRHYDHERGKFTQLRKVRQGDLVVVSGLHVLTSMPIRETVDLAVFLDMDEHLRTLFKVERDARERGHSVRATMASMSRRVDDRERFIQPQSRLANLVLRLEPEGPIEFIGESIPPMPPIRAVATLRDLAFGDDVVRALTSIAGAQCSIEYLAEPGAVELRVAGTDWISERDIAAVAKYLIPRPEEIFLRQPNWLSGSRGVLQLILVIAVLERRRTKTEGTR